MDVSVSVQAGPTERTSWTSLAADIEAAGFDTLVVPDHPGTTPAPFVALAAAATTTERIGLGTCVVNAGMWEPLSLAAAVATLDVVSGGRAVLGIGAGHTPAEWTMQGRRYPTGAERVAHLIDLVGATTRLLAGETVTMQAASFSLQEARLDAPQPIQDRIPLLVGGNGDEVLRFAARKADVVGITGLGRTLGDGHRHEVDWSRDGIRRVLDRVHAAVGSGGSTPAIDALVQYVEITDDAEAVAARLVDHIPGATARDLLDTPFVWFGSVDGIRSSRRAHRDSWGIDRYTIRAEAVGAVKEIFAETH